MHLQSYLFLLAILLAQSSFAYNCCYEIRAKSGRGVAEIIGSGDEKTQVWTPRPDCEVVIDKSGGSCGTWKRIFQGECLYYAPISHVGVTGAKACGFWVGLEAGTGDNLGVLKNVERISLGKAFKFEGKA
ncbi:hypothetical protein Vi05172_g4939 [Venturia inaequalis]|nr:hypothetical protein Vi05172_g4939 [Venturia inaequalis]